MANIFRTVARSVVGRNTRSRGARSMQALRGRGKYQEHAGAQSSEMSDSNTNLQTTEWEAVLALPIMPGRDHIRGDLGASLWLTEYADFECPHCAVTHRAVETVRAQMGADMAFVYRHYPITTIHRYAWAAAEAAEAAASQGKFWQMHDALLEDPHPLTASGLLFRAKELRLNLAEFETELITRRHADRVQEDLMSGVRSGVRGTPTFFVNGQWHRGGSDVASLITALQTAAAGADERSMNRGVVAYPDMPPRRVV
jgi:protein-disulfide isomerase